MHARRLTLLLAPLLALALTWWFTRGGPSREESPAPGPGSAAPATASGPLGGRGRAEESAAIPDTAIEDGRARSARESIAAPGAADPFPREREALAVRVESPSGAPLEGARVEVTRRPGDEAEYLDREFNRREVITGEASTGAAGTCAFELPVGRPHVVAIEHPRFAPARRAGAHAGDTLVVRLHEPASVTGRVTRAADATAVAGAHVALSPRRGFGGTAPGGSRRGTVTDANGAFRLERLEPGVYDFRVEPREDAPPRSEDLDLEPGETLVRDVVVEAGATVRGRVTDAATGEPLAGAELATSWTFERPVRTDAEGRYELRGFAPSQVTLSARARGYATVERSLRGRLRAPIPDEVDFELPREHRAVGRLLDAHGEPVAGAYVAATASVHSEEHRFLQETDWCPGRTGPDGRFRLVGLHPRLPHVLVARAPGHGSLTLDFPSSERQREVVDLGDVVLPRAADLGGVVVDGRGAPLAGLPVTLRWSGEARHRLGGAERSPGDSVDSYVAKRTDCTDARGRFLFRDLEPGDYRAAARLLGVHEPAKASLTLREGERRRDLVLTLDTGLAIEGRVRVSDGGATPTTYLSIDPERGGVSADVEARPDGSFEVRGLTPGTYRLTAYPYASDEDVREGRRFGSVVVPAVVAGTRGVDVLLVPELAVGGRVLDAAGAPVEGASVELWDAGGDLRAGGVSGVDGGFELRLPAGEVARVVALPPAEDAASRDETRAASLEAVEAGTTDLELVLPR